MSNEMLRYSGNDAPTEEELNEAVSNDLDPATFPRDSYARLRKTLSHQQIIDAIKQPPAGSQQKVGIPIEDLERSLRNNDGNYDLAVKEARTYLGQYETQMLQSRNTINQVGIRNMRERFAMDNLSSDGQKSLLNSIVDRMFSYHATCKNRNQSDDRILMRGVTDHDSKNYPRAHRWVLTQIARLNPTLLGKEDTTHFSPEYSFTTASSYDNSVNKLINHYRSKMLEACINRVDTPRAALSVSPDELRDYLSNQRKLGVAITLGNSKFYPLDYTSEVE